MTARDLEAAREVVRAWHIDYSLVECIATGLAQARREALEEAAKVCEEQEKRLRLDAIYNLAHVCANHIRALAHDDVETAAYDPLAVQAREIVAVCNQCGPRVAFDEDECCVTCGGQVCEAYQDGDRYVFNWPRASDGGEGSK